MPDPLPQEFLDLLKTITAKRAKIVIDHILKHGHVTTEELKELYGYNHPPRAARDVREQGVPLETFTVKNAQDRAISAYKFGDHSKVRGGVLSGRKVFPKEFKNQLAEGHGTRCRICLTVMDLRYLQIDHRVPYEVAGEGQDTREVKEFMLLCGSCNRAKSWSCEHCPNWTQQKNPDTCRTCYWASPTEYTHVATLQLRRLDVTWNHDEIASYDDIAMKAKQAGVPVGEYVKQLLKQELEQS